VNLVLRLPRPLHAALVRLAQRDLRSLNAQMIYLLRKDVLEAGENPDGEESTAKTD
jgi:hypothetical protein